MKSPADRPDSCPLCERQTHLSFHHFIPRKVHRRAHFKKHYSKEQLQQGAHLCKLCHSGIHKFYDEMTLAKHYNSLELIKADSALSNHFAWVSRQRVK